MGIQPEQRNEPKHTHEQAVECSEIVGPIP